MDEQNTVHVFCHISLRATSCGDANTKEILDIGAAWRDSDDDRDTFSRLVIPRANLGYAEARLGWVKSGTKLYYKDKRVRAVKEREALLQLRAFISERVRHDHHVWLVSACGSSRDLTLLLTRMAAKEIDFCFPFSQVSMCDLVETAARIQSPSRERRESLESLGRAHGIKTSVNSFATKAGSPPRIVGRARAAARLQEAVEDWKELHKLAVKAGTAWGLENKEVVDYESVRETGEKSTDSFVLSELHERKLKKIMAKKIKESEQEIL